MTANTALAEHVDAAPPANVDLHPTSDSGSLLQIISRAASDPSVDIDKMERLLQMHERLTDRGARAAFAAALADMQPRLPVVGRRGTISVPAKDGKTGHETPYALWEDINEAIRPLLKEHGFALFFRVRKEADRVEVTGVLSHREGHSEETTLSLPMDATGSKNNVQAIGSSTSYGKRYTAMALLNITTHGEDDDGRAAEGPKLISEKQALDLNDLIEAAIGEVGGNASKVFRPNLLKYLKIDRIDQLRSSDYQKAVDAINSARPKK